ASQPVARYCSYARRRAQRTPTRTAAQPVLFAYATARCTPSSVPRNARTPTSSAPRTLASVHARQHAQQCASSAQQASVLPDSTAECPVIPARVARVPVACLLHAVAPGSARAYQCRR
ncbi:Unknown protein, partial [Striga hermonthica]